MGHLGASFWLSAWGFLEVRQALVPEVLAMPLFRDFPSMRVHPTPVEPFLGWIDCPKASRGDIRRPFPGGTGFAKGGRDLFGLLAHSLRAITAPVTGPGCLASPIRSPRNPMSLTRIVACYAARASSFLMSSKHLHHAHSGHAE